jgi:predicted DNA-binding protein (MmcQ/YjbR family)
MHTLEDVREFCLTLAGVTEELPFGPDTLVFKVMGKVFAIAPLDTDVLSVNLKCQPEKALELRERYAAIQPGYHMNKQHWNTVYADGSISNKMMKELILHSYELVVHALPVRLKKELNKQV